MCGRWMLARTERTRAPSILLAESTKWHSAIAYSTAPDQTPTISIAGPTSVLEPDSGTRNAEYTIALSNPSSYFTTVFYTTTDGSAKAGESLYQPVATSYTFAPGSTTATFDVPIIGDTVYQPPQNFSASITGVSIPEVQHLRLIPRILPLRRRFKTRQSRKTART